MGVHARYRNGHGDEENVPVIGGRFEMLLPQKHINKLKRNKYHDNKIPYVFLKTIRIIVASKWTACNWACTPVTETVMGMGTMYL